MTEARLPSSQDRLWIIVEAISRWPDISWMSMPSPLKYVPNECRTQCGFNSLSVRPAHFEDGMERAVRRAREARATAAQESALFGPVNAPRVTARVL